MAVTNTILAELEQLRLFHRAVAKAAGDLDGLPDGHAFEIVWRWEEDIAQDEDGEPREAFITAGMIRRAGAKA